MRIRQLDFGGGAARGRLRLVVAASAAVLAAGCGSGSSQTGGPSTRIGKDINVVEAGMGTGRFGSYVGDRKMLALVRKLVRDLRGLPRNFVQPVVDQVESDLSGECRRCLPLIESALPREDSTERLTDGDE